MGNFAQRCCWAALLLLHAAAASAHLSGFTDTSIQIAQPGVKIIYTVPADNLLEIVPPEQRVPNASIKEPEAYLDAVIQGWSIVALGRSCFVRQRDAEALTKIGSYQYTLVYECPQGFEEMVIGYTLFGEQWRGEQNYLRIFMAGDQMRLRFAYDRKELRLDIPALLKQWGKPLAPAFFSLDPNRKLRTDAWLVGEEEAKKSASWWESLENADPAFIQLGTKHILEGADHILFVIGLLLVPASWARLAGLVTSFTAAHSITLSLSAFGVLALPPSVTEPLIALTVVAIGVENIVHTRWRTGGGAPLTQLRAASSYRWLAAFGLGLIHGVGLSYLLTEMGFADDRLGALVFFNAGVELGQLVIIAVCLPVVIWLFRRAYGLRVATVLSSGVALFGAYWFVERLMAA
jgi:HupE / UreJ protein